MKVRKCNIYKVVERDDTDYSNLFTETNVTPDDYIALGVRARVELRIPHGKDYVYTHVTTPGLWGILVPSMNDPYLDEVFEEEKKTLIEMLESIGRIELTE